MLTPSSADKPPGIVVTFYSFKGGVGRSMALANVAVLLARAGKRVLCIDWDLEAPGLDRYFRAAPRSKPDLVPVVSEPARPGGLLDILENSTPERPASWRGHLRTRTAEGTALDFLGSGDNGPDYSARLADFSWKQFFAESKGGDIVEALRAEWKQDYDFVLVDSRTGLTDSSGVCTIQMPDLLILLFAANRQNVDWCERIARGIREGRRALPYDRAFLPIVPVLARFDAKEESDRAGAALNDVANRFGPYFADWLPRPVQARDMVAWSFLPYLPRYSFDEALAVEDEPTTGPDALTFRYQLLADLIQSRFQAVRSILTGAGVPGAAPLPMLPSATELRAELRRDSGALRRYREAILARAEDEPLEAAETLETLADVAPPTEAESLLGEAIRILADPAVAGGEEIPRLMCRQAHFLADIGRAAEGEILIKEALVRASQVFGEKDIRTAYVQDAYARFLQKLNRKPEAVERYALAVKSFEAAATPDPVALRLALEGWRDLLNELGRWPEMVGVARRVWDLVEADETSGPADRALALDRYGTALQFNGQSHEAVERFQAALRLEEQAAAAVDSLGVGRALNNLAGAFREEGRYTEAEPLFRRALAIYEKTLGPEHSRVAAACGNLAWVLHETGRYTEAEPLFRRALEINEKNLGPEHSGVAADCGGLASLLRDMGRYAEAEALFRRALAICEKALGPEHPGVGAACGGLASVLRDMGRYAEAEALLRRALAICEKALGPEHPDVANACGGLASVLRDMGRYAEAEALFHRMLAIYEKALGPEHPGVAAACGGLATLLRDTGRYAEAEPLFRRALAICERALGPEHPYVGIDLVCLAQGLSEAGDPAGAEPLWPHGLDLLEKGFGPGHDRTGRARWHYAEHLERSGRHAEAQAEIEAAVDILIQALGAEHPDTVKARETAGCIGDGVASG